MKAQVRRVGISEIAPRNVIVFEAMMTSDGFTQRYQSQLSAVGVSDGDSRAQVEQNKNALGLEEQNISKNFASP